MSAAEREASVATAKWQEQSLKTSALLDAIANAIWILDGTSTVIGADPLACNTAARRLLDEARKAARG